MKKKIFIISVLTFFVLALSFGEIFSAQGRPGRKVPILRDKDYDADCFDIHPDSAVHVIQLDQWGVTWYDEQQIGSMGRMIAVTSAGQREATFMRLNAPPYPSNPRYVAYNCKNALDAWCGVKNVDGGANINAGYTNIAAMHDGREAVIYDKAGSLAKWYTTLAIGDPGQVCVSGNTFAKKYDIPHSLGNANQENGMWPKMGIVYDEADSIDYMHIVMTEGKTGYAGDMKLGYVRCYLMDGVDTLLCETPTGQAGVVSPIKLPAGVKVPNKWCAYFGEAPGIANNYPNTISVIAVTSPVSQKVALVFTNKRQSGGYNRYNNDVCYTESDSNGIKWFPQYGGWWPPTLANGLLHYVTNYATSDFERAFTDVSACYDYNDNLHIVWNAHYYDSVAQQVGYVANLYHWSQATGISLIASGYRKASNPQERCIVSLGGDTVILNRVSGTEVYVNQASPPRIRSIMAGATQFIFTAPGLSSTRVIPHLLDIATEIFMLMFPTTLGELGISSHIISPVPPLLIVIRVTV
jgi:hypothetical protein